LIAHLFSQQPRRPRRGRPTFAVGLLIAVLLVTFLSPAHAQAADGPAADLYTAAATAYEKGDFQTAHDLWLSLIDDYGIAADLFYNLGNTSHRLGNPGEAALWYQRALVIDPTHAESLQNLKVIERQVGFMKIEWNPLQRYADTLTRRQLIIAAAIGFWAVALSLALPLGLRRSRDAKGKPLPHSRRRTFCITTRVLGVVTLTFALATLLVRRSPESLRERSIVTVAESIARTGPADDSKEVIALPPGTQVDRLAERASWSYLAIPGDLRGWIHSEEATPLWPFDASFLR
jgi:tetratricopeptide (TPR) repeat protein